MYVHVYILHINMYVNNYMCIYIIYNGKYIYVYISQTCGSWNPLFKRLLLTSPTAQGSRNPIWKTQIYKL